MCVIVPVRLLLPFCHVKLPALRAAILVAARTALNKLDRYILALVCSYIFCEVSFERWMLLTGSHSVWL